MEETGNLLIVYQDQ